MIVSVDKKTSALGPATSAGTAASPTIEAFHRLLQLVGSRVTVSEILDLLAVESVHLRFEISAEDLDTITEWVGAAGVRWGVDAQHRGEHGQPRYDQNTWRFGLQRLLLGYGCATHRLETALQWAAAAHRFHADVFAVPGPIHSESSSPTRTLPPIDAAIAAICIWLRPAPSTLQR